MSFTVGLTGGIGSGKTSAANFFMEFGAAVADTDEIAHRLTRPGQTALDAIREAFGAACIGRDGALDRPKMRDLVFADSEARKKLEGILHPLIRQEVVTRITSCAAPYLVIVVPLFLETGHYRDLAQRVLVVDCDEATQVCRTMARGSLSREEVRAIMATQVDRPARLRLADDVLVNNGELSQLKRQVHDLHKKYLALARTDRFGAAAPPL